MTISPPFVGTIDPTLLDQTTFIRIFGNPNAGGPLTMPDDDRTRFLGLGSGGQVLTVNPAANDLIWTDPGGFDWNAYPVPPESQDVLQGNNWPEQLLGIGTDGITLYRHTRELRNFAGVNAFVKKSVDVVADPELETTEGFEVSATNGQRIELTELGTSSTDLTSFRNDGANPLLAGAYPQRTLVMDGANGLFVAEDNVRVLFTVSTTLNVRVDTDFMAAQGFTYQMYAGTESVPQAQRDMGLADNQAIALILSAKITYAAGGASEIRGVQIPIMVGNSGGADVNNGGIPGLIWFIGVDASLQCSFLVDLKKGDSINGRLSWSSGNNAGASRYLITASRTTSARTFANEMPKYRYEYV